MANPFSPPSALSGYNSSPPSDDGQETDSNRVSWASTKTKLSDPLKTYVEELATNVNTAFATVDNAAKLTQGELADARLSSNVPLLDAANTWSGVHTHSANSTWQDNDEVKLGTGGDLRLYHDGTDSYIDNDNGDLVITAPGDITLNGVDVTEYARLSASNTFTSSMFISATQPTLALSETDQAADGKRWDVSITGGEYTIATREDDATFGEFAMRIARSGTSVSTVNFPNGTLQSGGNAVLTTADEGSGNGIDADTVDGIEAAALRDATINSQAGDYTLVLTDAGKTIYKASGGGSETITVPANSSVAFPTGTMVTIVNQGGGDLSIAITTDTMTLAGAGSTGTRTLADDGVATLLKLTSTSWIISGVGLS